MTNDVPNRTLPYPDEGSRTHWEGCWRAPRHHNCAVVEADARGDALDREREALRELLSAMEDEVPDHGPSLAERAAREAGDGPYTASLARSPHNGGERWCDTCMPEYGEFCDFGREQTMRIANRAHAAKVAARALLHPEDDSEGKEG